MHFLYARKSPEHRCREIAISVEILYGNLKQEISVPGDGIARDDLLQAKNIRLKLTCLFGAMPVDFYSYKGKHT